MAERKEKKPRVKDRDCRYCYYWMGKIEGCTRALCIFDEKEEDAEAETDDQLEAVKANPPPEGEKTVVEESIAGRDENGCKGCPYARILPCIGYCIAQLLHEVRSKKQPQTGQFFTEIEAAGKLKEEGILPLLEREGEADAGRSE